MAVLFSCLDYEGVPVSCDEDQWNGHVLVRHPEMAGLESAVQRVIARPSLVYADRDNPDTKIYYGAEPRYTRLRVVIRYKEEDGRVSGKVWTAFPSPRIRPIDALIWTTQTR